MEAYNTDTLKRLTLELQAATHVKRVWLENGALHRMSVTQAARVKVLQGTAWITHGGEDFLLQAGQRAQFDANPESTLIGALGDEPVVFEVW